MNFGSKANIDYDHEQLIEEVLRVGGGIERLDENSIATDKELASAKRRLKSRGIDPHPYRFEDILIGSRSPWGIIDNVIRYPDEGEGLFLVGTPTHGGLWLSDKWIKKLPKSYNPCSGSRRWAEEDQDAQIVLQFFSMLSLVSEPMELKVNRMDIENGRMTRKSHTGEQWFNNHKIDQFQTAIFGGPLVQAYKRITGVECEMICSTSYMQLPPSGWKHCKLPDNAKVFMKLFDKNEYVSPETFILEPYIYQTVNVEQITLDEYITTPKEVTQ